MLLIALCVLFLAKIQEVARTLTCASLAASTSIHLRVSRKTESSKYRRRRFLLSFQLDKKFLFTYSFNLSWNTFTARALLMLLCPLRTHRFITKVLLFSALDPFPAFFQRPCYRGFNFVITRFRGSSLVIIVDRLDVPLVRSFVRASFFSMLIAKSRVLTSPLRTSDARIFNEHGQTSSCDSVCRRFYLRFSRRKCEEL